MSNSPLATYRRISPNRSSPRNHKIDTVTIHCICGQWTAKQGCDFFASPSRQCSANYVVGRDGSIGVAVDESDRSWCSSSRSNDNRAITIEVASDTSHPYAVTDAALHALIRLLADICKRNGIPKLLWRADPNLIGDVDRQNMTVHRWFANKSCPGEYLYSRHGWIADEVNRMLHNDDKNGWKQDAHGWYFLENGSKVVNNWRKDNGGWCYLGPDGYMVKNRWEKDSQHWYYMGPDGHFARNQWVKDSKDWCYLDSDGWMATNCWQKDNTGWCFIKDDGHILRDGWASDNGGKHHMNAKGYMEE